MGRQATLEPTELESTESAQKDRVVTVQDGAQETQGSVNRVPEQVAERPSAGRTGSDRPAPTDEEIRRLAYEKWEEGGRREVSALDNWLEAERSLRGETKRKEAENV